MRRLLVILAAFGMIFAVQTLRMDGGLASPDPLTLAAVGFVVLAAFTVGELGGALKLPKITGYIVSGVLLGPQVSDILSKQVVGEMQTFNTLALGLIATTAGLELDLGAIRKVLRTLLSTVAAKVPLLVVIVGGAFYAVESTLGILGLADPQALMALGLVFAVLGVGTSPAIALAIVNETGAKGRLSDLVLAIAVVKDLVVVVCLAIAIAVARVLIAPDAPLGADVLVHVAEELGASIAVGAVVGGLLIAYMRFVKAEMLLAVLVAILLTAEVSKELHLELLLVFIAAGFVVRNLSKYEHELLHSLERIALPVFVVFFTTAGANVDLEGTVTLLPIALVIAGARALAFFLSAKFGAKVGKESAAVADNAWFAYLPQAGVTLGLVFLAAEKLPELAEPLEKTGMAMVALHLLVGPVLLGLALRRAGEIPDAAAEPAAKPEHEAKPEPGAVEAAPRVAPPEDAPEAPPAPPSAEELAARIGHEPLVPLVEQIRAALAEGQARFLEEVARPRAEQTRTYARDIFEDPEDGETAVMAIHRRLPKDRPELVADWVPAVLRLEQSLRAEVHRLPAMVAVEMTPSLLEGRADDSLATSARKVGLRIAAMLGSRRGKVRDVPLRLLGRLACEARLAEAAVALAGAWPRSYAAMLDEVRAVISREKTQAEAFEEVERVAEHFYAYVERTLAKASTEILDELATFAISAGGPELPLSSLRFSKLEPVARAARQRVEREAEAWHRVADAAFDTVRARTAVLAFGETLVEVLDKRVRSPLETAKSQILPVLQQIQDRMRDAAEQLDEKPVTPARAERAVGQAKGAYPKADRTRVRRARARFRRSAQAHLLVSELSRVIEGVPAELNVLPPGTVLDVDDRVEAIATVPLDFGRRAEAVFLERLAPRLDEVLEPVADFVAGSDLRFDEVVQVAVYGIEAAREARAELDDEQVRLFEAALTRALAEGEALQKGFEAALEEAEKALETEAARAGDELASMLGADPGAGRRVRSQVQATRRAIRARLAEIGRHAASALAALGRQYGPGAGLGAEGPRPLDAAGLRAEIEARTRPAAGLELPPLYDKLFSTQPVEDLRLAVAHRDVLERVSRRIAGRKDGSARVLVVGAHGSGRTSLLNAIELRHQRQRVLRLDAFFHLRAEGVVSALAAELSCRDHERAVLDALLERNTVVLVDDLERHITANEAGARELERLVQIVIASRGRTAWVVTTTESAFEALDAMAPFAEAFGQRVELPPLSPEGLAAVVEARGRLGGVRVELPRPSALARLRRGTGAPEEAYYARLCAVSGGNLRAGLQAHLRSLRAAEEGALAAARPEPLRLPPLTALSVDSLAILGLLLRFGPHDLAELCAAMRRPESIVRLCTLHLLDAGLLYRPGGSAQEMLYVPPEIERALTLDLERVGLAREGSR